jgi:uncharacterized beta-barrel protein YwiB (DUF1934 family)
MKYTSKVKSEQTIKIDDNKVVVIKPGSGEMSEEDVLAVAKTPWGKRLIETEYLKFDKPIEIKDEKVQHGMSLKPGDIKPKKAGENIPDFDKGSGKK